MSNLILAEDSRQYCTLSNTQSTSTPPKCILCNTLYIAKKVSNSNSTQQFLVSTCCKWCVINTSLSDILDVIRKQYQEKFFSLINWDLNFEYFINEQQLNQYIHYQTIRSWVQRIQFKNDVDHKDFLRGCINFKSVQNNMNLLFHGFIHSVMHVYIPSHISEYCLQFCEKTTPEPVDEWVHYKSDMKKYHGEGIVSLTEINALRW